MADDLVFRDRFGIETFGDEGVLIDLATGSYFQLNGTATKVCLALQATDSSAEAAALVAASLEIRAEQALSLVEAVRADLAKTPVRSPIAGPFRYKRQGDGYLLEDEGTPVLTIDGHGQWIRRASPGDALRFRLLDYVRGVTPKLLYLRGTPVLHASACVLSEGVTAFAGPSGAGKTTTARAFAKAGRPLLAEDLLLLAPGHPTPTIALDGERRAHDWADETCSRLATFGEADCDRLDSLLEGAATRSLDAIWFVDRSRRVGDSLQRRPLSPLEGALALMSNNFLGADDPESWRRHARECYRISGFIGRWELATPQGVERLVAAARAYATKTAS